MTASAKLNLADLLMRNGWVSHSRNVLKELASVTLDGDQSARYQRIDIALNARHDNLSVHHFPISIFGDRVLSSLHFNEANSPEQKRQAFKQGVDYIDIETSSQCNRKCHYCTNSTLDRLSENKFLNTSVLASVLRELAEIQYDKEIHFVGYNEPLMHRESIVNAVKMASKMLPDANIVIFTNGDYLDREYLLELIDSGVSKLNISVHLAPGLSYSGEEVIDRIFKLSQKLGLLPVLKHFVKKKEVFFSLHGCSIEVSIFQRDYSNVGHDRGGLLQTNVKMQRSAACSSPLKQFIVGYTGTVLPCCALVGDDPRHSNCVVGNATTESIFDIYSGAKYIQWRRGLLKLGPKNGACKTCNGECETLENNDPQRYHIIEYALSKI